jgi:O-antigen ligase
MAVSITLAQTALVLLALRFAWRLGTGRARPAWPLAGAFASWMAASLLAALASARPLASLGAAKDMLLIAAFYVLLDALGDAREAGRWGAALFGLVAVVAALGVLQVALCPWLAPLEPVLGQLARKCPRAHSFYSIYMTLAGVLSLVLLAALPRVLSDALRPAPWVLLGWLIGAAGLVATYVRGAWLGCLAGIGVTLGLWPRRRWLALATVALVAAAALLVPGVRQRASSIVDPSDPTARERWAMWSSALAMARDHPLTGVGPGQVKHEYPRYVAPEFSDKRRGHVHNTPLQVLAERGALGLVAWLAIFATFFTRGGAVLSALPPAAARERALVTGSLAAIAGFLVGGLTEYNFGDSEVVLVAYAVMVLPFVVGRGLGHTGPIERAVSKRPSPAGGCHLRDTLPAGEPPGCRFGNTCED